jgi:nicotinamide riboside kinase
MKPGKIISFSGAQSTGKSTLLNKLATVFKDSCFFIPEITRKLREQGHAINEDGDDITQRAIINTHEDNMDVANVIASGLHPKNVIMDRCIWDGVIYTSWLHHQERVSQKTVDYAYETFDLLIGGYDLIFYTDPSDVPLVDDGERSANKEFRDQIIEMFENSVFEVSRHTEVVRLKGSVEKRMKTILEYLK